MKDDTNVVMPHTIAVQYYLFKEVRAAVCSIPVKPANWQRSFDPIDLMVSCYTLGAQIITAAIYAAPSWSAESNPCSIILAEHPRR